MEIPQEQAKVLTDLAASGDVDAGKWLSDLGHKPAPGNTGEVKKDGSGAVDEAKAEAKPDPEVTTEGDDRAEEKAESKVDPSRDGDGGKKKGPSVYDTIKDLRRRLRESKAEREGFRSKEAEYAAKLQQLEARLKSLPDGASKAPEEDELTRLLTKPGDFLAERDKKLLSAVRQAIKEDLAKAESAKEAERQKSSAIEILGSIPNFDIDDNEDEVFDLMQEEYGWDESDLEYFLKARPEKTARQIRRAWEKNRSLALPEKTRAEKAAAKSPSTGGVSTHTKTTLKDLDAKAKGARTREEINRLWEEVEKAST